MGVKILVIGLWHLGLVHCACLPKLSHTVIGTDFDETRVEEISGGKLPIYEPGLEELVNAHISSGALSFSKLSPELLNTDFIFIAFDTPVDDNDVVDLSIIDNSTDYLLENLKPNENNEFPAIVMTSQVPVGTCRKLKGLFDKKFGEGKVKISYVPENLRLNNAIKIFLEPDRMVFGVSDKEAEEKVLSVFDKIDCKKIVIRVESAEMSKHAMNAYLATCISFSSELADLCESVGANAFEVVETLKADSRVSPKAPILPGFGFAGGTLGRDIQTLRKLGEENKIETALLDSVLSVNRNRINALLKKIRKKHKNLSGLTFGLLGLTYKPNTDTLRRSISLEIASALKKEGAEVKAFDPKISEPSEDTKEIILSKTADEAAKNCDALILATEWPEFKEIDFKKLGKAMKSPEIYDIKNFLDHKLLKSAGFEYYGMGV
ncbi:MAG: nucleotide sugar dehydrogenase [archaeon]